MSPQRHARMLRLSKDLGMNAIRLEGKLQVCTEYAVPLTLLHDVS